MNQKKYVEYIIEKLSSFNNQIEINAKLNLLDLNVFAEDFFAQLFNIMYGYNFENANKCKSNQEAIDLIDYNIKTVMQVTSNTKKEKIDNTLGKKNIEELSKEGFKLRILIIKNECGNLKKANFKNIYNIDFTPSKDIITLKDILNEIKSLNIDKLELIYQFFIKQFEYRNTYEKPNFNSENYLKTVANITYVLNLLAKEVYSDVVNKINFNEFNINKKIEFNDLCKMKKSINDFKVYMGVMDRLYNDLNEHRPNGMKSVFNKLCSFYEDELLEDTVNMKKFLNIIKKTVNHVKGSSNYDNSIPEEELELCVKIIVIDAFIKCKIFENPELEEEYDYKY